MRKALRNFTLMVPREEFTNLVFVQHFPVRVVFQNIHQIAAREQRVCAVARREENVLYLVFIKKWIRLSFHRIVV